MSHTRMTTSFCMRVRIHARLIALTRGFSPVSPVNTAGNALTWTYSDGTERSEREESPLFSQ